MAGASGGEVTTGPLVVVLLARKWLLLPRRIGSSGWPLPQVRPFYNHSIASYHGRSAARETSDRPGRNTSIL